MEPEIRIATPHDLPRLLPHVRAFWAFERLDFGAVDVPAVLGALLADERLGRVLLAERDGAIAGYCVLGFGYSLEHYGRDAVVDELYVVEDGRGSGLGTQLLERAAEVCRAAGVRHVHLEVDGTNPRAEALYRRLGFAGKDRRLLTRELDAEGRGRS